MIDLRKPHWLAAYTKPRNEKKVYERLINEGYEVYLPLQKKLKKWSDRKKIIEEPLLRSYIFVRITEKEYFKVLNTLGIVRYVSFEGKAAPIPDKQIDMLKMFLGQQFEIESLEENIELGDKVEIRVGTMSGILGELVHHQGKKKVVVQIDHISHKLLVTLPSNHIIKAIK